VQLSVDEYMTRVERSLMAGRGRWVADFNESFRNYKVNDVEFDAFICGNTRVKGFLLSRLFSFLTNPNYSVGCFFFSTDSVKGFDKKHLIKLIIAVKSRMKENEMRWAWLFLFGTRNIETLRKYVEGVDDQTVGIAFLDTNSKNIAHSNSYLGKQAKRYIRI